MDNIIPDKQAQSGIAERRNRILNEAEKSMLIRSILPKFFWVDAVRTACFIRNRVTSTVLEGRSTPYEMWYEKNQILVDRKHLVAFYVYTPKRKRKKLDKRSLRCIFIGYVKNGYLFYEVETGKLLESIDAKFF